MDILFATSFSGIEVNGRTSDAALLEMDGCNVFRLNVNNNSHLLKAVPNDIFPDRNNLFFGREVTTGYNIATAFIVSPRKPSTGDLLVHFNAKGLFEYTGAANTRHYTAAVVTPLGGAFSSSGANLIYSKPVLAGVGVGFNGVYPVMAGVSKDQTRPNEAGDALSDLDKWVNIQVLITKNSDTNVRVRMYVSERLVSDSNVGITNFDDGFGVGFFVKPYSTATPAQISSMHIADLFFIGGEGLSALPGDVKVLELEPLSDIKTDFIRDEEAYSSNAEVLRDPLTDEYSPSLVTDKKDATDTYRFGESLVMNASGIVGLGMKVRWQDITETGVQLSAVSDSGGEVYKYDQAPVDGRVETVFKSMSSKPGGGGWSLGDIEKSGFGFNLEEIF